MPRKWSTDTSIELTILDGTGLSLRSISSFSLAMTSGGMAQSLSSSYGEFLKQSMGLRFFLWRGHIICSYRVLISTFVDSATPTSIELTSFTLAYLSLANLSSASFTSFFDKSMNPLAVSIYCTLITSNLPTFRFLYPFRLVTASQLGAIMPSLPEYSRSLTQEAKSQTLVTRVTTICSLAGYQFQQKR